MKKEINVCEGVMYVDLEYPRNSESKEIDINLVDVRASDGIRISYDFDRDGWVIKQPYFEEVLVEKNRGGSDYYKDIEHFEEVAFIQSWQLDYKTKRVMDE